MAREVAPEARADAVAPGYMPTNLRGRSTLGQGASLPPPSSIDQPHIIAGFAPSAIMSPGSPQSRASQVREEDTAQLIPGSLYTGSPEVA